MDYDDLCREILKIDPAIRFAGICDSSGKIRYGGERQGLHKLFTQEETERSLIQALARWELRKELSAKTGKGRYAMAEYERMKRITVPMDETHLLLVTVEVWADHVRIIDQDILISS